MMAVVGLSACFILDCRFEKPRFWSTSFLLCSQVCHPTMCSMSLNVGPSKTLAFPQWRIPLFKGNRKGNLCTSQTPSFCTYLPASHRSTPSVDLASPFLLITSRHTKYRVHPKGHSYPTFCPHNFLFFFEEKQETFPKVRNLTEGKIFGTLRIPTFGKKNEKYGNAKKCGENKSWKFRRKVLR